MDHWEVNTGIMYAEKTLAMKLVLEEDRQIFLLNLYS